MFSYQVDAEDKITSVSNSWLDFAVANGAENMRREKVIGSSLWEWIADPETRHLYQCVFAKVREQEQEITLPFRCDSPTLRRFMQLRVALGEGGCLNLNTEIVRQEEREAQAILQLTASDEGMIRICGWCKRVHVPEDQWLEVEDAVRELGLFQADELPQITHTICPPCKEIVLRELDKN